MTKILVFAGSTRKDSYNKKLAKLAEKGLHAHHSLVTYVDLSDFPMPLYDGDLEATKGIPENAMQLRRILHEHQAFLICSPEYNSSISGVLKNAIDWASRPIPSEPYLNCFTGKVIRLMSASISQWGGLRGLVAVRSIFSNMGCMVLPDQLTIPLAEKAFTPDGELVDELHRQLMDKMCHDLIKMTSKLSL